MRKLKFYLVLIALLIGLLISWKFQSLDKFLIARYLGKTKINSDKLVVITVEELNFFEDKLWPWQVNWPEYLISFILDLKPQKLILGPNFVSRLKDFVHRHRFLEHERVYLAYSEDLKSKDLKFSGHMVFKEKNNYLFSYTIYNNLPAIGYLLLGKVLIKSEKFYFLDEPFNFILIPASNLALAGFLRGEGYRGVNLETLKDKIVFLEMNSAQLGKELSFLSAQLDSKTFKLLPRELGVYLGIFLFVILYILLKPLKIRMAIFVFLICLGFCFTGQRFYFNLERVYVELTPILTFGCLGFLVSVLAGVYELRSYTKIKREMQMARLLKEKEILPHSVISSDGIFVSVTRYKTEKVGGDFYQFLEFAKGELGVAIGWTPGEGLDKVKYIMEIVHSWRDFASIYKEPIKVVQVLNNALFKYAEEAKYVTFIYMLYDAKKGTLKYVNAGHDPIVSVNKEGEVKVLEADEATPLGVARDVPFQEQKLFLLKEDILFTYSGGISKLILDAGGLKKEFLEHVKGYSVHKPEQLADEVFHDLLHFYPKKSEEEWSLLILKITE